MLGAKDDDMIHISWQFCLGAGLLGSHASPKHNSARHEHWHWRSALVMPKGYVILGLIPELSPNNTLYIQMGRRVEPLALFVALANVTTAAFLILVGVRITVPQSVSPI